MLINHSMLIIEFFFFLNAQGQKLLVFNCSLYSLEIAHITFIIHMRTVNTFLSNNQLKNPTIPQCLIVFISRGLGPGKITAMLMRQNEPDT